jgi:membrane protein
MNVKGIAGLFKTAAVQWVDDYAQSMGAALAFYTMFSIAPLLLIVISIVGIVFGEDAVRGAIFGQLQALLGEPGALAVQELLDSAGRPIGSATATLFGVAFLFVAATSVFAELQDALNRIWRVPQRAPTSGLWTMVRNRMLSFGMILGIGFLLTVSLAFSAGLAALSRWLDPLATGWATVANAIEIALGFALSTAVFALIYKTMPKVRIHWKDVWIGAGVTSIFFSAGKFLIGAYIGRSDVSSAFGAAASLIVVLLWVYYSAQIFLYGAEFTWVYSHQYGSRKEQSPARESGPGPAQNGPIEATPSID